MVLASILVKQPGRPPLKDKPMTPAEYRRRAAEKQKRAIVDRDCIIVDLNGEILRIGLEVMAAKTLHDAQAVVTRALMKKREGS